MAETRITQIVSESIASTTGADAKVTQIYLLSIVNKVTTSKDTQLFAQSVDSFSGSQARVTQLVALSITDPPSLTKQVSFQVSDGVLASNIVTRSLEFDADL